MSGSQWFSLKLIAQRVFVLLLLLAIFSFVQPTQKGLSAPNATFTVNSSGDAPDWDLDDGVCDTDDGTSGDQCSLRAAIQQANAPNTGHDIILFDGFRVISLGSELPALTNINGTTIYSDDQVFLLGTSLSAGGDGLTLTSNHNKVMGLVIAGFDNGVVVNGDNNVIGTDGDGIDDVTEKNVIYSNDDDTGYGIQLVGNYNVVAGNLIGLQPNGSDIGANSTGIWVSGNYNRIGTDGDGISDIIERNIISGNTGHGIDISGDYTVVAGNYIGIYLVEKLSLGIVALRIITQEDASSLVESLQARQFGVTVVEGLGAKGKVQIVFTIIKRAHVPEAESLIRQFNPQAFYSIEEIGGVEKGIFPKRKGPYGLNRLRVILPFRKGK